MDVSDPGMKPAPLNLSRLFPVSRETLFNAWSAAAAVERWFCPEDCSLTAAEVDFRRGGAFNIRMRLPDGTEHWVRSIYTELEPPERLAFASRVSENGKDIFTVATIVIFTPEPGGTRMDVVQSYEILDPFWAKAAPGAEIGWASTLNRLAAYLTALTEGDVHG